MKRQQIVKRIHKILLQVVPTADIIVYGSEARGDARHNSDIDLLILLNGDKISIKEEERIITPLYDLELETGVPISARVLLKKHWKHRPFKTPFYINVINEGIVL